MDGRKNVSISHILPGGRYASAADSWISPWTARSDRGLVKISQQQYFSALFLLTHVTTSDTITCDYHPRMWLPVIRG